MALDFTQTEHEIASLAARGRTNREIATVLGLSPKTVEWNLTKVYRSLRVRSRTELAATWPGLRDRSQAFAKNISRGLSDSRTTPDTEEELL